MHKHQKSPGVSKSPPLQTSSGINQSPETVHQELHHIDFQGSAAPACVIIKFSIWFSIFRYIDFS